MKKLLLTEKDFDWYKLTPKQIRAIGEAAVTYKKDAYTKIKDILPENRTYENTIYALECSDGPAGDMLRKVALLGEVSPKKEVRDTVSQTIIDITNKMVDIQYDRGMYIAVLEYYEGNFRDEKKKLKKEDIKLLEDILRDYRRMGFDLPQEKQNKLKTLIKKSSKLGEQFRKNINDYSDYIVCSKEELDGLSDRIIATLPKDESGKYLVSLQYPHYGPFMSYATNRKKRQELAQKNLQKGGKKNLKIITELIKIRKEKAAMLGYPTYADYRLEDRMAKKASVAEAFQNNLLKKLIIPAKKDVELLHEHGRKLGLETLEYFDTGFVSTHLKKTLYDIDQEALRSYFPLAHVMDRMFRLFGPLFGIKFIKKEWKLWHNDVMLCEVRNANNTLVGYLFFDLFPRDGKYGHAMCVDTVIARETGWNSGTFVSPVTGIVCNFPAPNKKHPSLLSLGEVETLFHEFGHALHMTLSSARHEAQSGANVAWDFVETPSQIMENWVWNDHMLAKLSKHATTGKPLPPEMRKKILASKKFQNAYGFMHQLIYGKIDMDLHTGKIHNATDAYRNMVRIYLGVSYPEKYTLFPAGFGHLVGYDAGYYSYLWALVYAQDAFSVFEEEGITNSDTGMRWRQEVLEKGSSVDEMELMKKFLGRKPSDKAFLKELGVK